MSTSDHFFRIGKSQKGLTLIEVLISLGIIAVLAAVFAQYQLQQMKETKASNEKSATVDLEKVLIQAMADGSGCLHALNTPTPLTFDSTAVSPTNPQTLTPTEPLYAKVVGGTPGPLVARIGDPASPAARSVVVSSIRLQINEGSGTTFKGNWIVEFNSANMVRPLRPAMATAILRADITNPTAATIVGCMASGSGASGNGYIVINQTCTAPCSYTNTTSKPVFINAWGGDSGSCAGGTNSYDLRASVDGNIVAASGNTNPTGSKNGDISFFVAPGSTAYMESHPWYCGFGTGNGAFRYSVFSFE